jgi:hypothetical protein
MAVVTFSLNTILTCNRKVTGSKLGRKAGTQIDRLVGSTVSDFGGFLGLSKRIQVKYLEINHDIPFKFFSRHICSAFDMTSLNIRH